MDIKRKANLDDLNSVRQELAESGLLGEGYREITSCLKGQTFFYFVSPIAAKKLKIDSIKGAIRVPENKKKIGLGYESLQLLEERAIKLGLEENGISEICTVICSSEEAGQVNFHELIQKYDINYLDTLLEKIEDGLSKTPDLGKIIHLPTR